MHQKRSAWILTGAAPDRGSATTLADLEVAVQTEIPLVRQHLSDAVWALRGGGVRAERCNRLTGERTPLQLAPSAAASPRHGFATVVRFFPGARELLGGIDEELFEAVLGTPFDGRASCFEDQYISSGGQLYELMAGRDRFVIDVRPWPCAGCREAGTANPAPTRTTCAPSWQRARPASSSPTSSGGSCAPRSTSGPRWTGSRTPTAGWRSLSTRCCRSAAKACPVGATGEPMTPCG